MQPNRNYANWKEKIKEKAYPFDITSFVSENEGLINKFLKKNTFDFKIDDFLEIPDDWLYKNNNNVISSKAKRDFSLFQKLEWIKCSLNSVYFSEKYVKIISIDDGVVSFDMYDYQRDMIDLFQNNRLCIACTGRQQGKTTTAASYILWFATFHESKESAVLANKADQAQEIMERIQMSYELLPWFLKQGVRVYNKRSMVFSNGSKTFSGASSTSSIRGRSISLLYWDEAAHTPNDIEFYESVFPTLSSGKKSKLIMTSTPNGARGLFHKIWMEHEQNGFARIKVTWDMIPHRDEQWKRDMIAASSEEQFRQEHECVTGETIVTLQDENGEYNISIGDLYTLMGKDKNTKTLKELAEGKEGVVYKLTRDDFQEYVGTTVNLNRRIKNHMRSERFSEHKLLDYEILFEGDYYDCLMMEEKFIKEYDTFYNGLNESINGQGNHLFENFTTLGKTYSEEARKNVSEGHKKRTHYASGWKHSDKTKKEWSEKRKGKPNNSFKISESECLDIVDRYNSFSISLDLALPFLKKTQKVRIEKEEWDGEPLIFKNGHEVTNFKLFSLIVSEEYGVSPKCIKKNITRS